MIWFLNGLIFIADNLSANLGPVHNSSNIEIVLFFVYFVYLFLFFIFSFPEVAPAACPECPAPYLVSQLPCSRDWTWPVWPWLNPWVWGDNTSIWWHSLEPDLQQQQQLQLLQQQEQDLEAPPVVLRPTQRRCRGWLMLVCFHYFLYFYLHKTFANITLVLSLLFQICLLGNSQKFDLV